LLGYVSTAIERMNRDRGYALALIRIPIIRSRVNLFTLEGAHELVELVHLKAVS
jgi:hypothetical protein